MQTLLQKRAAMLLFQAMRHFAETQKVAGDTTTDPMGTGGATFHGMPLRIVVFSTLAADGDAAVSCR